MTKLIKRITAPVLSLVFLLNMSSAGMAETTVSAEVGFIFNTLLFLICGFLVMFMAAGFAMLESGMVTSKSVSVICAKNIGLYAIAGIMFWLVGYNLAYGIPEGGYIGSFTPWSDASAIDTGYADGSDWFFQMVFCATTVSICSGAMAERIKLWPFFLFAAILAGVIYPIVMGWQWGGGWLAEIGFSDFAGSTLVHSTGGAAALAGIILLGARNGRFDSAGNPKALKPFAASSIPLVTIGVFILWLGWFGFNAGSQLAISGDNANAVADIIITTNLAAVSAAITSMFVTWYFYGKPDISMTLNGVLAGLVAITAGCAAVSPAGAVIIGIISGVVVVFSIDFIDKKLKIDDPVGAISVHGVNGALGTLLVGVFAKDGGLLYGGGFHQLAIQAIGVFTIAIWAIIASFIVLFILKKTMGLRVSRIEEEDGLDKHEHDMSVYN
jgi:Amt family ammonium transporter